MRARSGSTALLAMHRLLHRSTVMCVPRCVYPWKAKKEEKKKKMRDGGRLVSHTPGCELLAGGGRKRRRSPALPSPTTGGAARYYGGRAPQAAGPPPALPLPLPRTSFRERPLRASVPGDTAAPRAARAWREAAEKKPTNPPPPRFCPKNAARRGAAGCGASREGAGPSSAEPDAPGPATAAAGKGRGCPQRRALGAGGRGVTRGCCCSQREGHPPSQNMGSPLVRAWGGAAAHLWVQGVAARSAGRAFAGAIARTMNICVREYRN